jgi:heme exporter protein A
MEAPAAAIEADGLGRRHGERPVLRGVSFTVPAGATLVVLGANGAGKSTLLRVLATLLRPHAGSVRVLGAELPGDGWRVRGRLGLLSHEPLLYRDLSGRENLTYHARLHGVGGERVEELLGAVGMASRAEDPVRTLSRGMVQRVAVCRAVLHDPELLLLDEPDSHLDAEGRELARELIGRGRTRVLVSHDPERALPESDRVLVLEHGGRVAHLGPAATLDPAEARKLAGAAA